VGGQLKLVGQLLERGQSSSGGGQSILGVGLGRLAVVNVGAACICVVTSMRDIDGDEIRGYR
jgi:hypothetical protein